jgi:hypothetical protein
MLAVVAVRADRHDEALRLGDAAGRTLQQVAAQVGRARTLVLGAPDA